MVQQNSYDTHNVYIENSATDRALPVRQVITPLSKAFAAVSRSFENRTTHRGCSHVDVHAQTLEGLFYLKKEEILKE